MLRSWRELRGARRKGRRDGRAGVPGTGQDALPFDLLEIMARAQERAQRVLQRWKTLDRERQIELDDREQRAIAAEVRLAEAETQRDDALGEHERRAVQEDERLARLQAQLEELPAEAGTPAFALPQEPELPAPLPFVAPIAGGAPTHPALVRTAPEPEREPEALPVDVTWRGFGPFAYWSLIALIVLGEIPLNAFAFRLFHEPDLLTYSMTVTVAVGLVAFAHAVGLFLSRPERTGIERLLIGVFVALPVAAIAVISLVRFGYLVDVGGDNGIGPVIGTFAFGLINLLVFGAAAGLSYLHHDPRTLVNRRAAIRAAERDLSRAEHRREEQERKRREREQRGLDEQRRRELELQAERHRAELEARKNEALLAREQISLAMRLLLGQRARPRRPRHARVPPERTPARAPPRVRGRGGGGGMRSHGDRRYRKKYRSSPRGAHASRTTRRARLTALALVTLAAASCSGSGEATDRATVVLFDVSNSTRTESVRARYDETFGLVLEHLREDGGVLGADVVDSNPLVHGDLPINETFEPCTITDNSLDCREALEERERRVLASSDAILQTSSRGTDVFGALTLAEQFFQAYPQTGGRTLVLLSDMVQSANGMHLGAVEAWTEAEVSALLAEAPSVDLAGVRVYVVGAGATTLAQMTPAQIEGIQRFWTRWFEQTGARVVFYGANLARFPIETEVES